MLKYFLRNCVNRIYFITEAYMHAAYALEHPKSQSCRHDEFVASRTLLVL